MPDWPHYDDEQIEAVVRVLRSGRVNAWTGPEVGLFEEGYASALGRRHAIAVANGSLALDLALHTLNIGPGDEVIVPPRSFVATASCVALRGARPVFADVDPDRQSLTPETIAAVVTPRTRAVIVVHLGGWPADMPGIVREAERHGIRVIEDCAQAHGAELDGRPVGSFGDIAAFSFCQDKIVTTGGEGGLLAMDDDALWERAWSMKDHGKSPARARSSDHPPGFRWLHDSFGTNMRLTGPQAALGLVQLGRLPEWRGQRASNAAILADALRGASAVRVPLPSSGETHAWYRFYAFVRPDALRPGWSRDSVVDVIARRGAPAFSGSCGEIYRETAFQRADYVPPGPLPVARDLAETSLCFPVDPSIAPDEQARRAAIVRSVLDDATDD